MITDLENDVDYEVDMQIKITNLNTNTKEWLDWDMDTEDRAIQTIENVSATKEEKWKFLNIIASRARIDQDGYGRLIVRSGDFGVLITQEEVSKCVTMAAQNRTVEEITELLEFEAIYNSSTEEFQKIEGEGVCAILALVGTINPQLNSYIKIRTRVGRNEIADVIEKVLIPSTQKYTLPEYTHIDQGAQERMYYKEYTTEYLEQIVLLLRETMDTKVERERWMYASSSATVIQASPYEAAFWRGIGLDRWIALYLWSRSAGKDPRQTVKTLQTVLRPCTKHIVSLNSHCFNIEDIRPDTCVNLINEIVLAIVTSKQYEDIASYTQIPDHQTQAYRVKRRDKLDANPHILRHNINNIGMSALPDKAAKRLRHTSTRRRQAIEEEDLQEKTNR